MDFRPATALPAALGIAVLAALFSPGAIAALKTGEVNSRTLDRYLPRSPVILRVQVLLSAIGLFRGLADGRVDDDLTEAVRRYQKGAGLKPDGRISEALLRHIEFSQEAKKLLTRLKGVSTEQREIARRKLAEKAATRDLLDPSRKSAVADPTRDSAACFEAPTVACLIEEAVETAKAIHRPHFRDWSFGEIAIAQARTGKAAEARRSAGRIDDPRLIIVALRNIAQVQARSGYLERAREGIAVIPDDWARAEALAALAIASARSGDWPSARELVRRIETLVLSQPAGRPRTELLANLARGLAKNGDADAALALLERERERLVQATGRASSAADLSALAAAFADLDHSNAARQIVRGISVTIHLRAPLMALARADARIGRDRNATAALVQIPEARFRAVAQTDVADIQLAAGRTAVGLRNLRFALTAVANMKKERSFARSHALGRISDVWRRLGDFSRARKIAGQMPTAGIRARTQALIAASEGKNGYGKERAAADYDRLAADLKSSQDKLWLGTSMALALAEDGEPLAGAAAFRKAVDVARAMISPWAKTQALVHLANTLITISNAEK